jgi:hypothetical protein
MRLHASQQTTPMTLPSSVYNRQLVVTSPNPPRFGYTLTLTIGALKPGVGSLQLSIPELFPQASRVFPISVPVAGEPSQTTSESRNDLFVSQVAERAAQHVTHPTVVSHLRSLPPERRRLEQVLVFSPGDVQKNGRIPAYTFLGLQNVNLADIPRRMASTHGVTQAANARLTANNDMVLFALYDAYRRLHSPKDTHLMAALREARPYRTALCATTPNGCGVITSSWHVNPFSKPPNATLTLTPTLRSNGRPQQQDLSHEVHASSIPGITYHYLRTLGIDDTHEDQVLQLIKLNSARLFTQFPVVPQSREEREALRATDLFDERQDFQGREQFYLKGVTREKHLYAQRFAIQQYVDSLARTILPMALERYDEVVVGGPVIASLRQVVRDQTDFYQVDSLESMLRQSLYRHTDKDGTDCIRNLRIRFDPLDDPTPGMQLMDPALFHQTQDNNLIFNVAALKDKVKTLRHGDA